MNLLSTLRTALISSGLLFAPLFATAADAPAKAGRLIPVNADTAAWAAEARKTYPLTTCIVSDEPLGSMGKAAEYVYRVEGQADRLVQFCCGGCRGDFLSDPAAHLAKLEAARAGEKPAAKPGEGHAH